MAVLLYSLRPAPLPQSDSSALTLPPGVLLDACLAYLPHLGVRGHREAAIVVLAQLGRIANGGVGSDGSIDFSDNGVGVGGSGDASVGDAPSSSAFAAESPESSVSAGSASFPSESLESSAVVPRRFLAMVFVDTRLDCEAVARYLRGLAVEGGDGGIVGADPMITPVVVSSVDVLHGGCDQVDRFAALRHFQAGCVEGRGNGDNDGTAAAIGAA